MYDSRKDIRWMNLKIGLIITAALGVMFITIMFAGNIEELFVKKAKIYAIFTDVKGLREGAPVWFAGIEIGSVRSLSLTPDRKVKVELSISPDAMRLLKKDSEATILTLGLLGDKYIELSQGSAEARPLHSGDTIKGVAQIEFKDFVETSQASLSKLTEFIHGLERFIKEIEEGEGTLTKLLKDPELYNNLKKSTENINEISEVLKEGRGSLGKLLRDDSLYQELLSTTRNLKDFTEKLKMAEGTLNRIIEDPELYNKLTSAADSIAEFSDRLNRAEGSLRRIIEERELYDRLNSSLLKLERILEEIQSGKGLMGAMIKDEELKEDLKKTLQSLDALIEDIKKNPRKYFKFSLF